MNPPPASFYGSSASIQSVPDHHNWCGLNYVMPHVTTDNTPVPRAFASATTNPDRVQAWGSFCPSDGPNTSSGMQNPSSRTTIDGQDHVVAARTTASPASTAPASVTSLPPTHSHSSSARQATFKCLVDYCQLAVRVDIVAIAEHLSRVHGYLPPCDQEQECRWVECLCKCRKRQPSNHRSHSKDMPKHLWDTHMGFREPCSKCGEVRWGAGFSKRRHEDACTGGHPRRCTSCYEEFPSELMLSMHYKLEACADRLATASL
jgi:hypothetical protein